MEGQPWADYISFIIFILIWGYFACVIVIIVMEQIIDPSRVIGFPSLVMYS